MSESSEVVALLEDLIRIDSANPALVPGAPGEARIAEHVTAWLTAREFTCARLEAIPGRPSVVAVHRGSGGGPSVMLNGHLDTVSHGSYDGDGLDPVQRVGRLHGRGAYDMKSGLAAIMAAAAEVARNPHGGDIVLALVADEEYASQGTAEVLAAGYSADAAIVAEPTGLDIVTAHRGFAWFDLTIQGRAAHGSRRDLGIDAIAHAGAFLSGLADHDIELAGRPRHPLLGTGNIHAGTISGGEERSSYPASCHITLERRTLPGETAATVAAELGEIFDPIAAALPVTHELRPVLEREPFEIDTGHRVVSTLQEAFAAETGGPARIRGEAFWTDCALLARAGDPHRHVRGRRGGSPRRRRVGRPRLPPHRHRGAPARHRRPHRLRPRPANARPTWSGLTIRRCPDPPTMASRSPHHPPIPAASRRPSRNGATCSQRTRECPAAAPR